MRTIPDSIHQEMLNWARWCWMGEWPHPLPPTHCGSLESAYRAPPAWHPEDPPLPSIIKPNVKRARIVQSVYDSKHLPPNCRLVMKAEYPCSREHRNRESAARTIGITLRAYETMLSHAINKVEEAFAVRPRGN